MANTVKLARTVLERFSGAYERDKKPLKAKIIETPIGVLMAVSNEKNLLMLSSAASKHLDRDLRRLTHVYSKPIIEDDDAKPLTSIQSELDAYFKGDLVEFQTPFEIDSTETEFHRAVWNEIYKIEYGTTSTYSELAHQIGRPKSYRAVANACGRNPLAIVIPCHRVLATGGELGGYSSGVEKKIWLLNLEK